MGQYPNNPGMGPNPQTAMLLMMANVHAAQRNLAFERLRRVDAESRLYRIMAAQQAGRGDTWNGRTISKHKHFSIFRAGKKFLKGALIDPIKSLFTMKGLLITGLGIAATCAFGPPAAFALLGLGLVTGGLSVVKGTANAISRYKRGDIDGAERSFEKMGLGTSSILVSLLGIKGFKPEEGSLGGFKNLGEAARNLKTRPIPITKMLRSTVTKPLDLLGAVGKRCNEILPNPVARFLSGLGDDPTKLTAVAEQNVIDSSLTGQFGIKSGTYDPEKRYRKHHHIQG